MSFKFFLNGHELSDEPIRWENSRKKLKRSEKHENIFLEYITDLEFHGDGKYWIDYYTNLNGICSTIEIYIQYKCNEFADYADFFWGRLSLDEAEWNEDECTIKCNAEDNSLAQLFLIFLGKHFFHKCTLILNHAD